MKTSRQASARAPSVRTSSSHRSTIETRGVPEFDRDYARQLSVAKRGRMGSVKASPLTDSAHESPLESDIGHFPGSAAAAATLIKDYVVTHVTPPRPFRSSAPHRANGSVSARSPDHNGSNGMSSPTSAIEGPLHGASPLAATGVNSSSTFLFGPAAPSAKIDGARDKNSPPITDSLNSTRHGSLASLPDDEEGEASGEKTWVFVLRTTIICLVSFFVLLCVVSFVVSSDKDYNPTYFSFGGGSRSTAAAAQGSAGAATPRLFPDRFIPQLSRQLALCIRRALGQLCDTLGVMRAVRFSGRMVLGIITPFRMLSFIIKEGVISPVTMFFPRLDVDIHSSIRYVLHSTDDAKAWCIWKGGALFGSIMRSLLQFFIEPIFIIGRTLHTIGSGFSQSMQLFSVRLVGQNVSTETPLHHNATVPVQPANRGGRTSVMSRATSHILLHLWRPMQGLWTLIVPLAVGNTTSSSMYWTELPRNFTPPLHRNVSEAHEEFSPLNLNTSNSHFSAKALVDTAKQQQQQPQVPPTVRTTHTHRLFGELWGSFLEQHADKLNQLAQEDLRELLGSDVEIKDVQLRPGSLLVSFTVVGRCGTAGLTKEKMKRSGSELRRTAQSHRDAQIARGRFSRLEAFYDEAIDKMKRDSNAASAAVAAQCNERVTSCQKDCDDLRQQMEADLQACKDASTEMQRSCEATRATAHREGEAVLRDCQASNEACHANASSCSTRLTEMGKALEECTAEQHDTVSALTAAQEALAAATVDYASGYEVERQQCIVKVAEARKNCSQQLHQVRAALVADYARDLKAERKVCEDETQKLGEDKCATRLQDQERTLKEKCEDSMGHAETLCLERLAQKVAEVDHTSMNALKKLQEKMNASAVEAAQQLAACESAGKEAKVHWEAEQREHKDALAAQLAVAQTLCQETERHAAAVDCERRLTAQADELHASCNAAVRQSEATYRAQLTQDVAALNSSAATTLAQLRETVDATKRAATESVAACETLREVEKEACTAMQRRLNATCTAQLMSAHERCETMLREGLEAERQTQQHAAQDNWTRQAAVLTAQCSHDTQRAVAEVRATLQAQYATKLNETTTALKRQAEAERRKLQEAAGKEREMDRQLHAETLRSCETRVAVCVSERRAAQTAQANAQKEERRQLFSYLAENSEGTCLRMSHHDKSGCAAVRGNIEATLRSLSSTATPTEALDSLCLSTGSGSSNRTASLGYLTWNFTGSGLRSLRTESRQGKGATPWLHIAGMFVGLASAAYALFRRQRDRRLYKDTIAQLNALIAANETTMALRSPLPPRPRRGRLGAVAAAFADDAPESWAVAAACLANCTNAFVSWHFTSCAVLFEQSSKALQQQQYEVQCRLLSNDLPSTSDITHGDATVPSVSHGGLPPTSIVSASTLPLTDAVDASHVDATLALVQMHEAFVSTYYNILEMYYVDLLNAVANRELAESQLQEAESVASRQASILHKQSAAVTQLKRALAEKEKELAQRRASASKSAGVSGNGEGKGAEDRLAREKRKTAAQQEMINLLEGQLQASKEELDRARGVVQTPGRTPRSEGGADSLSAKQVRSLQELADAENDSTNSSDFSNTGRSGPQRVARATTTSSKSTHTGAVVPHGTSAEVQHTMPVSALKKPASMVRDPESMRRYHKLRWNDESGAE